MKKVYVIGESNMAGIAAQLSAMNMSDDFDIISIDSIGEVPDGEMVIAPDPIQEIEFAIRPMDLMADDYKITDEKKMKKMRKIEKRGEYRSKKDRRNHR